MPRFRTLIQQSDGANDMLFGSDAVSLSCANRSLDQLGNDGQ